MGAGNSKPVLSPDVSENNDVTYLTPSSREADDRGSRGGASSKQASASSSNSASKSNSPPKDGPDSRGERTERGDSGTSRASRDRDAGSDDQRARRSSFETAMPLDFRSIDSLPRCDIKWKRGQVLGRGSFGSVVLGMELDTGRLMAVKQIPLPPLTGTNSGYQKLEHIERETNLLKAMSFPNIVNYYGVQVHMATRLEEGSLDIFLEFVPGGSIAFLLKTFGRLEESVTRQYTRQILLGLEYLHRHKIVHRDIKGGNVLVDPSGMCKLTDFGTSMSILDLMSEGNPTIQGTVSWMAPEVIKQEAQGVEVDIWSVGCTVLEMATGSPPWSDFSTPVAAMLHIASTEDTPHIPDYLSHEAQDFLRLCLQRDQKLRPTANELLQHPFVLPATAGASPAAVAPSFDDEDEDEDDGDDVAVHPDAGGLVGMSGDYPSVQKLLHAQVNSLVDNVPTGDSQFTSSINKLFGLIRKTSYRGKDRNKKSSSMSLDNRPNGTSVSEPAWGEVQPVQIAPDDEYKSTDVIDLRVSKDRGGDGLSYLNEEDQEDQAEERDDRSPFVAKFSAFFNRGINR